MAEQASQNYEIEIRDPHQVEGVHFYTIKLIDKDKQFMYSQQQRYSKLRELHKEILELVGEAQFPTFPKKKWFGSRDNQFVSQRQKELQYYFTVLLQEYSLNQKELAPLKNFLISRGKKTTLRKTSKDNIINNADGQKSPKMNEKQPNGEQNFNFDEQNKPKDQNNQNQQEIIQPPAQIQTKEQQLQQQSEETSNKFINQNDAFNPIDEHQKQKRKEKYKQLKFDYNHQLTKEYTIPERSCVSNAGDVIQHQYDELQEKKIDELAVNLSKALQFPDIKADSTQIVHKFKTQV